MIGWKPEMSASGLHRIHSLDFVWKITSTWIWQFCGLSYWVQKLLEINRLIEVDFWRLISLKISNQYQPGKFDTKVNYSCFIWQYCTLLNCREYSQQCIYDNTTTYSCYCCSTGWPRATLCLVSHYVDEYVSLEFHALIEMFSILCVLNVCCLL